MSYQVTAAAVQVIAGARAHFIEQGGIVPNGVDQDTLVRLVEEGMLVEIDDPTADVEADESTFSQEDVDAAVKAATESQAAELAQAKADLEAAKAELAKTAPAAKQASAKQS